MNWEYESRGDAMVPLGRTWLRASEIESIEELPAKSTAAHPVKVTMRSGAVHEQTLKDADRFVRRVMGHKR